MSNFKIKLPDTLDYLIPTDVEMIRLGNDTDGGYVIPKIALEKSDALLSLGLGENWTFDEDWHKHKPNDPIHLYDGEKSKLGLSQIKPENVWNRFEPINLAEAYTNFWQGNRRHWVENIGNEPGYTPFVTALERLNSANVFLKMDIEGGEYPMLPEMMINAEYITGIAAEFHSVNTNRAAFENCVRAFLTAYDLVHIHANVTLPFGPEGLTEGIELTFLRKDLVKSTAKRYNTYHELDFTNYIGFPDFEYAFDAPKKEKKK